MPLINIFKYIYMLFLKFSFVNIFLLPFLKFLIIIKVVFLYYVIETINGKR